MAYLTCPRWNEYVLCVWSVPAASVYVCMCASVCARMCALVCVLAQMARVKTSCMTLHWHTCLSTCKRTHTHRHRHTHTQAQAHTHTQAQAQAQARTHTHTHIHTHTHQVPQDPRPVIQAAYECFRNGESPEKVWTDVQLFFLYVFPGIAVNVARSTCADITR